MNDQSSNIRKAQTALFERLRELELSLSQLYTQYARLFPEMQELWLDIAKEEEHHAKWVQIMIGLLKSGYHFYNLDTINENMLDEKMQWIEQKSVAAQNGRTTKREAIMTALSLEATIIESEIYQRLKSDAPSFSYIAERLLGETTQHSERINEALQHLKLP